MSLTLRTLARGILLPYFAPFKGLWFILDFKRKEKLLRLILDRRKRIGREPLLKGHKRVVNREYPSFGHTDYWKRLDYILPRIWDKFTPSKHL